MERNVNKFWFSEIGTLFPFWLLFRFTNNAHVQGVQFVKKSECTHSEVFLWQIIETWDEEKVENMLGLAQPGMQHSELFCFHVAAQQ